MILMHYKPRFPLLLTLLTSVAVVGCSGATTGNDEGELTVAAAFYPLEYAVAGVTGDNVDVVPLTTPGVEAHDVELTPRQVAAVMDADLVIYLSGFQPAVDEAVKQADPARVIDVAQYADLMDLTGEAHADEDHTDHDHGDVDPHFWLDPLRLAAVSDAIAERLADIDPEHAAEYTTHATAARADLADLDAEFTQGLKTCARREVFVSHSAFGYMAARHDLEQVAVAGISPNVEPSGARIAEVQELARRYGATTMFFETAASDAVAKSIAHDLGLETAVLDPIESVSDQSAGRDYPAIMRANLAAIQKANDCG